MWNLIAMLALAVVGTGDVKATKLDGAVRTGRLEAWSGDQIVLATDDGQLKIPTAELLSLDLSAVSTADAGEPMLETIDGMALPLAELAVTDRTATITARSKTCSDLPTIAVPLDQLRAVRLQPLDPSALPHWREIRNLDAPSDLLVVRKRGGKSLDYLEGVIGKIAKDEVEFTVDGKTVQVPRGKVAGLIFFRPETSSETAARYVLIGSQGLRIPGSRVRAEGEQLQVTTPSGLQLTWPLSDIASADFSAGKLRYLSDMEAVTQMWRPLIGLPSNATQAAHFGRPHLDQSAAGGPLTLNVPAGPQADRPPRLESFAKGMAIRSRTELVYRLPAGFSRFLAIAGIEPAVTASGNVMLSIVGDDRLLFESSISGASPPVPLDIDIEGIKRLKIVVDYGDNLDTGDWLNLCNARIIK